MARILEQFAIPSSNWPCLSELFTMTCPSWVALHDMVHSFIELHKSLCHNKGVRKEEDFCNIYYFPSFISYLFWVLSVWFLVGLARHLSILLFFSKYQLMVLLIFSIVLCFLFITSLIFIKSILCWSGALFVPLFLIILGGKWGCLLKIFFFFKEILLLLQTSLFKLLLLDATYFISLCFHGHLSQGIFWFPLWFHHWSIDF